MFIEFLQENKKISILKKHIACFYPHPDNEEHTMIRTKTDQKFVVINHYQTVKILIDPETAPKKPVRVLSKKNQ